MIDITTVAPENLRTTIAPIPLELLKEKFTNNDIVFLIEYEKSLIKGKKFVTFVGNLNLDCDVVITESVTKDERFELLREYIATRTVAPIPTLIQAFASVLCISKGIMEYNEVFETPYLTTEEIKEFIELNKEMIDKHRVLMDSMVVFAMASSKKYVEAFGHPKDSINNIDNANEFGSNFVHLLSQTLFMEVFFSYPGQEFHFFTKQFEEFMFSSKCLFDYFMVDGNPLTSAFDYIGNNEYTLEQASEDLYELEKNVGIQ